MPATLTDRPALDVHHGAATWRALGTHVDVRTEPSLVEAAAAVVADVLGEVDRACSRFRDDSDLSRANREAGTPVAVSPVLVAAVRVALEAAEETDGLVDPTLGAVLAGAGYDRTFALVPSDDPSPVALPVVPRSWRDVVVGEAELTVPVGTALDLGATGKAFAADLAAHAVVDALGVAVLVSVGGDLRALGPDGDEPPAHPAPLHPGYPVVLGHSVADLEAGGASARVTLHDGGLATSSTSARRWRRGGRQWHHVLDPRTGRPANGPWRTVSALGRTAAAANTASTAAVVLGAHAFAWLEHHGVAARLVDDVGRVVRTPEWFAAGLEEQP
ncbi:MAG TPA: FAD:protein FMN transferase [Phycicoccus sp.]|nr:FAD:protein FMN transferase [Phycicoccus sp.]